MLDILIILLILAWLSGWTLFHLGSLIHLLLVIAVIIIFVRLIRGQPPL